MRRKHAMRQVALAYPVAVPWMALFVRGVADFAKSHGGWNLTTSPPTLPGTDEFAQTVFSLRGWPGDGVIAAISCPKEVRAAGRLGIPVVNVSGAMQHAAVPRIMIDHYAIGRMAAEHLLDRGLRRLAYYGAKGLWYSQQRCRGFVEWAEQAGIPCDVLETPTTNPLASWQRHVAPLVRWLRSLRPPVGLLAVQDYRARIVVDECLRLGLDVPHDVAIVGVDNDPTVCEFCQPTLSSVSRNAWRMGFEAAALLNGLMMGQSPPLHDILIPPDGIVPRQSTDTVAMDDPYVGAAVHFMRDHPGQSFTIMQVMEHMSISRRQLEMRFRRELGCTPHEYSCRLRVERAKVLLASPQRTKLHNIATTCGFSTEDRMRLIFRRLTGQTPLEYRRSQISPHESRS